MKINQLLNYKPGFNPPARKNNSLVSHNVALCMFYPSKVDTEVK